MVMMLAEANVASLIGWSVVILVLLVVGLTWATRLKRRLKQEDEPTATMGFTLSDLRRMHRSGQLTDVEFAKARDKIVEAAQKVAERAPAPQGAVDRDSPDAIRARRLAREAQEFADDSDEDDSSPRQR